MRIDTFLDCLSDYTPVVLGDGGNCIVVVPDMEGRIFTAVDGEIISRVVEEEVRRRPLPGEPVGGGGDVLWVAPEGTRYGYFYAAGDWHIPAALCALRYDVKNRSDRGVTLSKPISVTTNTGQRLEMTIEREIRLVSAESASVIYESDERLIVRGAQTCTWEDVRLVPWTLAQYPTTPQSTVTFDLAGGARWKEVYQPVGDALIQEGNRVTLRTDGHYKYQIIMTPDVNSITMHKPPYTITRSFVSASEGQPADITDIEPGESYAADFPSRTSVYNSDTDFLELEVCGNSPAAVGPGTYITLLVRTECLQGFCQNSDHA